MDRRSLLDGDGDGSPRGEHISNVFDDEFEVPDFDLPVSDGFRPSHAHHPSSSSIPDRTPTPTITSVHAYLADEPLTPSASQPVRTSIQKPRPNANPFASSEDDSADEATPSLTFEPDLSNPRHSVSSASSHLFARTASVRLGSGPSHPYGMYPQATLARSPSATTSSTLRPVPSQSSSNVQAGPQHPYTLYPQGVEEELDDETPHNPVPVGFLGLGGQSYQRRRGPDGEEQDFIGEDGHAEQLPPYTRYPEDGPEKMPLMGMPEAPTALHSRAPVAGTDPTMPLMHTNLINRQQQPSRPQSMTDQSLLLSSPISGGHAGDSSSHLLPDKDWDEKSWKEKTWKERMKTRVCGCVPFWIVILALAIFVFIGSVLGGVIGGFVFGSRHGQHKPDPNDSLYDAKIIPTPPGMSAPTGTYSLALSTAQAVFSDCLTDPEQLPAWNCDLGGPPDIRLYIGPNVSTTANQSIIGASIMYGQNTSTPEQFYYGTQASWLKTSWLDFKTVVDKESTKYGPAFYFQTTYDKLVVLPGSALQAQSSPAQSNKFRRTLPLDKEWFKRKQIVKPADKPWFCVWKNTMLEGFVYPQQPINPASANISWASSLSSSPATTKTETSKATETKSMPTLITTTTTFPWTTLTFTGNPATMSAWVAAHMIPSNDQKKVYGQQHREQYDRDDDDYPLPPPPVTGPVPGPIKRQENLPAMFPYIVKLEERRVSGNTDQPYCEQWQILEDGELGPLGELPPTVILTEDDPQLSDYQSGFAGDEPNKKHSCHCQWTSGQ